MIKTALGKTSWIALLPLAAFAILAGVFFTMLLSGRDNSVIPSALIGKPAPDIALPVVAGLVDNGTQVPGIPLNVFAGRVSVVNFWASWCPPCKLEHPLIMAIAEDERVQVIGINYKDRPEKAVKFLAELGNPYDLIGADADGRAAIEWGVYGMPETYLVDKTGTIIFKITGAITPSIYKNQILPRLAGML